jgi:hypothetical protein
LYNGDSDYLHEVQQEGLPNITGSYRGGQDGSKNINVLEATGAFYGDDYKSSCDDTSNDRNTTYNKLLKLDASKGETKTNGTVKTNDEYHVYGKSDHVTTYNSAIQIWRRIS